MGPASDGFTCSMAIGSATTYRARLGARAVGGKPTDANLAGGIVFAAGATIGAGRFRTETI